MLLRIRIEVLFMAQIFTLKQHLATKEDPDTQIGEVVDQPEVALLISLLEQLNIDKVWLLGGVPGYLGPSITCR